MRRPRFGFASSAARVEIDRRHRVDEDVLGREGVRHGLHDREPVGVGDPGSLADVPLAVAPVAADVDVAQARVVAVATPQLGHQLLPLGEEGRRVPVRDVGAGLERDERRGDRGEVRAVAHPAARAVGHHPEAELAAAGAGIGEPGVDQREVPGVVGLLDASPVDLVAVVDVVGRDRRGRGLGPEPAVLATERVRQVGTGAGRRQRERALGHRRSSGRRRRCQRGRDDDRRRARREGTPRHPRQSASLTRTHEGESATNPAELPEEPSRRPNGTRLRRRQPPRARRSR